jgi:hypothetical protein
VTGRLDCHDHPPMFDRTVTLRVTPVAHRSRALGHSRRPAVE